MIEDLSSNITVEMDTQLLPPAIVSSNLSTKYFPRVVASYLLDNALVITGILFQEVTYKTFDFNSKIITKTLKNEREFSISIPLNDHVLGDRTHIPHSAVSLTAHKINDQLSGIGIYHRVFGQVAFNLNSTIFINASLDLNDHCENKIGINDPFAPQINRIFTKNISLNLKSCIQNQGLSNLKIKRFFIAETSRVFSETLLCKCCILYSFFNAQNELVTSEKYPFNFVINSNLINAPDNYTVVGADILGILESNTSNNCSTLNESLSLVISSQLID